MGYGIQTPVKRRYFTKAIAPPPKVRKVRPNHKGKRVIVTMPNGSKRIMASRDVALAMGRSKGGLSTHAKGKRHTWTSETGRKAVNKLWNTRQRFIKRIGARIGVPCKRRPSVARAPIRAYYATVNSVEHGIAYTGTENGKHIWVEDTAGITRRLSETCALRKLGHLPTRSGFTPKPSDLAPFVRTIRPKETE